MKRGKNKLKIVKKRSSKTGLPPGTLVYVGERKVESVRITFIDYDEQSFQEKQVTNIEECLKLKDTPTVSWINIDGLHDIELLEKLGGGFELHPLVLEDILSTGQRPKFEDYEKHIFIVLKMLSFDQESHSVEAEQVSLILGSNYVISFQERIGDVFEFVRERIRKSKGRVRKMGPDYLAYAILDAIVDNYFVILERFGEKIESMEEEVIGEPTEKTVQQIHSLKSEMILLRKSIWPLRELIGGIQKSESSLVKETTDIYLRDVYDHTIQIIDTIESFRDMVSGLLDIYLSSLSNKMNAVMKVLTIIATLFIPLTFVAGIYGMNFEYMPELKVRWAYGAVWLVMITIAVFMLCYFKRKKWL
jgi:magnesium transporter